VAERRVAAVVIDVVDSGDDGVDGFVLHLGSFYGLDSVLPCHAAKA